MAADALILADGERPMRNHRGSSRGTFCQADAEGADPGAIARRAADDALRIAASRT